MTKKLLQITLICVLLGILILSLLSPSSAMEIKVNDKIGHCFAYFVLTINGGLLTKNKRQIFLVAILAFAYGGAIELLQKLIPGRDASGYDLVANGIGILVGLLLLFIFVNSVQRKLKIKVN